ncbi:Major Facilitator Superfamily (MFS) transporter, partial [Phytophthora megakarya]
WIYCSEIFPMNVRATAASLSTAANCMTEVVKLFPYLNINGVFFMFARLSICCGLFVYYWCPETKGLLLEDIEELFHARASGKSPSYVEAKSPVIVNEYTTLIDRC